MYTVHSLGEKGPRSLASLNFDYDYPNGLDLKPGSETHERIKTEVLKRARESYDVMKRRHPDFRQIDRTLTAYIPTSVEEDKVKKADPRKPVSIVVPHSYAILETLLTYWTSIFLELPYFRYTTTAGNPIGTIMLEKVIEQQCIRNKVGLSLYTLGRDSFAYGFGVVSPIWGVKEGFKRIRVDGTSIGRRAVLFEGNRVENVDPYHYLPDPSAPIHDPQKGEFCGWIEETNYMSLLNEESKVGSTMFNARYIKGIDGRSSLLMDSGESDREYKYGGRGRDSGVSSQDVTNPVDVIWLYIMLVPQDDEWQLPGPAYPEKWLFGLAGDEVIICAMPLGLDHDEYPIDISAPDFDGYSLCPIGKLEVNFGLQTFLDFLLNSHVENVRKAINDMLIVDPYLININDLKDPNPGKLIRTRRAAWGKGVENAVKQLQVVDITKGHMSDAAMVMDIMNRSSSASDAAQGIVRRGSERRSATEYRDTKMGAISRMARAAKIASLMCFYSLGYHMASHTIQFMTQDVYLDTYGRFQQELQQEYGYGADKDFIASPSSLSLDYGILIHDGTTEYGEFPETWAQLYQILAGNPAVGSGFDMTRIFMHIARMLGAKNVNDFVRKGGQLRIQSMQDQQVMNELQAGNVIPVTGS